MSDNDEHALFELVKNNHIIGVRAALNKNPQDVHCTTNIGATLLHRVITPEMAKLLINKGALIDANNNIAGGSPIYTAENSAVAQVLIDAGANLNARNAYGFTPLQYAIRYKDIEIVKTILKADATNINMTNDSGQTALDLAIGRYVGIESDDLKPESRRALIDLLKEFGGKQSNELSPEPTDSVNPSTTAEVIPIDRGKSKG